MNTNELIDRHLFNASRALEQRNFGDFEFSLRSLGMFDEGSKREYHMKVMSRWLAAPMAPEDASEMKLREEWLHLGTDYPRYLEEVGSMFALRVAKDSRLSRILAHFGEVDKAAQRRRDTLNQRLKKAFGQGGLERSY